MAAVTELAPESDARRKEGLSQKEACCVHPPGCGRISGLSTACSLGLWISGLHIPELSTADRKVRFKVSLVSTARHLFLCRTVLGQIRLRGLT
eukprot:2349224-Rhodomonas_salina.2